MSALGYTVEKIATDEMMKKALLNAARKRIFSTITFGADLKADQEQVALTLKSLKDLDLVSLSTWASPASGVYQVTDKGFQVANTLR